MNTFDLTRATNGLGRPHKPLGTSRAQAQVCPVSLLGVSIESGVPMPDVRGKFNLVFAAMNNGESFMVPTDQQRQRALMSAKRMGHKAASLKVNGAGYRVWLVSKA